MNSAEKPKQAAKLALISGGILFFLAVVFGAFGAHALESLLLANGRLDVYETANQYHFYHAIGLLLVGTLGYSSSSFNAFSIVSYLLIAGTLIFSGSLYLLAITNIGWLGAVAPVGGVLLLFAWLKFIRDILAAQ